jgi:predicted DNA binding CopG/RHH family protein
MVTKKRVVPKFSSETEEAEWWYRNRDMISRDLKEVAKAGELKVLTPERLRERLQASASSRNITIRMQESDIERARRLAEKKGIGYQTYMKILLREALDREDRKAG